MSEAQVEALATEEVRESYALSGDGADFKRRARERGVAFDAWLADLLNEARREGWDEAHHAACFCGCHGDIRRCSAVCTNPYNQKGDDR